MEQLTSTEKSIKKVWIVQDVNFESFDYAVTAFHYFSEALTFVKSVLLAEAEKIMTLLKRILVNPIIGSYKKKVIVIDKSKSRMKS
ncbi:MAG: hypothetical protein ACI31O_05310 [Limosilactobacillus vaginalis]|uniref:hypothetical protein n=1 Tax=Limosilactobacillus vaginalis TaxID=1633 RepID=UPI003F09853A